MAANAGRAIVFKWNGAQLLGVREKGIALNGEAINITSDEDNGWRTLLDVSAEDSIDITLSGVTKDDVLKMAYLTGQRMATGSLEYPNGLIIEAEFYLANYTDTGPYNNATTFSATLQSNGPPTVTPAP